MEKKATNRKSKKEETPQVITTGIEKPALGKVSMLIITQTIRGQHNVDHWLFDNANYAKAEMQKDIEKFKQAHLEGTYDIYYEEEKDVVIMINNIQLRWQLFTDWTVEIEGQTRLLAPNRYNCRKTIKEEK